MTQVSRNIEARVTESQEVIDALKLMKKLIDKPASWIKRASARNISGQEVNYADNEAVCFCLLGALGHVVYKHTYSHEIEYAAREHLENAAGLINDLVSYNDEPKITHKDIIRVLNKAICKAKNYKDEMVKSLTN